MYLYEVLPQLEMDVVKYIGIPATGLEGSQWERECPVDSRSPSIVMSKQEK